MKKRLLVLFGIALSIQTAQAGLGGLFKKAKETAGQVKTLAEQAKALVEPSKEYKAGASKGDKAFTPISVEVKNKGEDIWVAVKTGDSFATEVTKVAAGATQPFEVSIVEPYEILVWNNQPASKDATPHKRYTFVARETAYVTADKGGTLRPQTGPAEGRLKKTDTGLSLSNNVRTVTAAAIVASVKPAEPATPTPAVIKPDVTQKAVPSAEVTTKVVPPAPPMPQAPAQKATPKAEPTPVKASTDDRAGLLSQIREGKALRPVAEQEETKNPEKSSQDATDILQQSAAFKKRTAAYAA